MSLMKTLAKVAVGVAVAKGMGHVMQKGGGLGGGSPRGGGMEDMLGDLLGGGRRTGGAQGGLGGMLEGLSRASRPGGGNVATRGAAPSGGGLDDLLGSLGGGGGAAAGGLGGLIGALAGAAASGRGGGGSFGDLLNQSLRNQDEPEIQPSREQEVAAGLMLKAMIQAAKSDGRIDEGERDRILGRLGDVSPAERDFVNAELRAPMDVEGLAGAVPRGLEPQVYAMSVMGIDLDNRNEAEYLHRFAGALGLGKEEVNHIHRELGAPALYG